jgi:hypothetical protein
MSSYLHLDMYWYRLVDSRRRQPKGRGRKSSSRLSDADAAAAFIPEEYGLAVAPVRLGTRMIYKRSLVEGQTAQEAEPVSKAAEEVEKLYEWVCRQLDTSTNRHVDKSAGKEGADEQARPKKRSLPA